MQILSDADNHDYLNEDSLSQHIRNTQICDTNSNKHRLECGLHSNVRNQIPLINGNPSQYIHDIEQILQALQTTQITQIHNKCTYQCDAYFIPASILRKNASNESFITPFLKTIQCDLSVNNLTISDHAARRSNKQQHINDVVLQHTNGLTFQDHHGYQRDVFIIKKNTDYTKDIIYKYTASKQHSIAHLSSAQVTAFCLDNTKGKVLGFSSSDSGMLTVSFHVTASKIDMFYTYGCGHEHGQYHAEIYAHNLMAKLSMFFEHFSGCALDGINPFMCPVLLNGLKNTANDIALDTQSVIGCFIAHDIDCCYFEQKVNGHRLKFVQLLRNYCGIKACAAQHIFDELYAVVDSTGNFNKSDWSEYQSQQKHEQIETLTKTILNMHESLETQRQQFDYDKYSGYVSEYDIMTPSVTASTNNVDLDSYICSETELSFVESENNLFAFVGKLDASLCSNIATIIMIIMADYLQLISSHNAHRVTNQFKLANMSKVNTTNDSMFKQTFGILQYGFLQSTKSNGIISQPSVKSGGSNSAKSAKPTHGTEQNRQSKNHSENDDEGAGGGAFSGSGGSCGGTGGGDDDKHNDDRNKKKYDKNNAKNEEEDEDEEDEEKTVKSDTKLNVHASSFTPMPVRLSTLDPIEEGDCMGPGSVSISWTFSTNMVPRQIKEHIEGVYWFMNKSLALQPNKFVTQNADVGVLNFDFTDKQTHETLYCVVEPQDVAVDKNHKWKMIQHLFTKTEIEQRYKIPAHKLPKSIRNSVPFRSQMQRINDVENKLKTVATQTILHQTKWTKIPVFGRKNNKQRMTLSITKTQFKKELKTFCLDKDHEFGALIPILVFNKNNQHHIEYVWLVTLKHNDIGISFKYLADKQRIKITGIHLDKAFIKNQHQLISPQHCCRCLDNFTSNINDLSIGNIDDQKNQNNNLRKQNVELKRQIEQLKNKSNLTIEAPDFYKSKLSECKQLIKELAQNVNQQDLKSKAEALLNSTTSSVHVEKEQALEDDDIKYDDDIATDIKMTPLEHTPTLLPIANIQMAANIASIQMSKSQLSYTPFIETDNSTVSQNNFTAVTAQSAPNPTASYSTSLEQSQIYPLQTPLLSYSYLNAILSTYPYPPLQLSHVHLHQIYNEHCLASPSFATPAINAIHAPLANYQTNKVNHIKYITKQNVFIPKSITTKSLSLPQIKTKFVDSQMLFYYLKHTINLQISNHFACLFSDDLIIINVDLCDDISANKLYAIIRKKNAINIRYEWELVQLCDDVTILKQYNITKGELPRSFRDYLQLCVDTGSLLPVLDNMKLHCLYVVKNKSRSTHTNESRKCTVTMSVGDLRNCIRTSLNKKIDFIPILKFKQNRYWIEHILICETPDKRFNFGVAFQSENGTINATAMFLDGLDIERQNMLTGKVIKSFVLNNFKSGLKNIIIEDSHRKNECAA